MTESPHIGELPALLRRVIERAARDPLVPGVIAAVHAPRLGFSWRDAVPGALAHNQTDWHGGLPLRIASVTKLFVATAVMRLVEDGRIAVDDAIAPLISQAASSVLEGAGHDPSRITVSHLLAHTSGLPDHTHSPSYVTDVKASPTRAWTRLEQLQIAVSMQRTGEWPGQRFEYSDTGYVLLGEILERSTGKALGAAVRELTGIDRLGLQGTHWELQEPNPLGEPRAQQFISDYDATLIHPSSDLYGGGGLMSTVDDLCVFMRAVVQGRLFRSQGTLSSALVVPPAERAPGAYMHSRLAMALPVGTAWGLGHLGYWGCGVVSVAELDITVASAINQPEPATVNLRQDLLSELAAVVAGIQRTRCLAPS